MQTTNKSQSVVPTMSYDWGEWIFTIYEYHFPNPSCPHYVPYLRPYEAKVSCSSERSSSGFEAQITVDTTLAHMRYLSNEEFRREQEARLGAYALLSLEELGRHDARLCVFGYPGKSFTVDEYLQLPLGLISRLQERRQKESQRYWFAFMQEISELEEVMRTCGPFLLPEVDKEDVDRNRRIARFWQEMRRYIRLQQWRCCDLAIPAHHYNAQNAFLILLQDQLEVLYFFQPGATLEENRTFLLHHGVLVNEYLYCEEYRNKRVIEWAFSQGVDHEESAKQLWDAAKVRGSLYNTSEALPHQFLYAIM